MPVRDELRDTGADIIRRLRETAFYFDIESP